MGEGGFMYTATHPASFNSFPIKSEDGKPVTGMPPYSMGTTDPYCAEQEIIAMGDKGFHEEPLKVYSNVRPPLHHISLSTASNSDSFHGSLPSGDSADMSTFDLSASEMQEYEWSLHSTPTFQWPPDRICLLRISLIFR